MSAAQLDEAFDLVAHAAPRRPLRRCPGRAVTGPGAGALDLPQVLSGKVRELYDAGDDRLLMVASDRVSAFDVVMAEPIPDKGRVLTAMTAFWCEEMADVVPGTLLTADPAEISAAARRRRAAAGMGRPGHAGAPGRDAPPRVHRARVPGRVRPTRSTSARARCTAWRCPRAAARQQAGRSRSSRPRPRRPRATTSTSTWRRRSTWSGPRRPWRRGTSASSCTAAPRRAAPTAGFVLADTKFELGYVDGVLVPVRRGAARPTPRGCGRPTRSCPATTPPAFDKQPLRDWLAAQPWDRTPPPPPLPDDGRRGHSPRATSRRTSASPGADWPTGTVRRT